MSVESSHINTCSSSGTTSPQILKAKTASSAGTGDSSPAAAQSDQCSFVSAPGSIQTHAILVPSPAAHGTPATFSWPLPQTAPHPVPIMMRPLIFVSQQAGASSMSPNMPLSVPASPLQLTQRPSFLGQFQAASMFPMPMVPAMCTSEGNPQFPANVHQSSASSVVASGDHQVNTSAAAPFSSSMDADMVVMSAGGRSSPLMVSSDSPLDKVESSAIDCTSSCTSRTQPTETCRGATVPITTPNHHRLSCSSSQSIGTSSSNGSATYTADTDTGNLQPEDTHHRECRAPAATLMDDGSNTRPEKATGRFACPYDDCSKSYTKKSHLKVHIRSHTGKCSLLDSLGVSLAFQN